MDIPVIILFGPTASGKTTILNELFAGTGKAEVISADSMQVYRGMDIGTAKPSAEERARLAHHLVDIREPCEQFNTGDFTRLAESACRDIHGRGKLPVISGGTGFYIKNFILGLPEAPPSDMELRLALRRELDGRGIHALMDELALGDPVSAQRIHINDTYRLLRALEVLRLTGRPLSSFQQSGGNPAGIQCAEASVPGKIVPGLSRPPFRFLPIALSRAREELYRRINARCESMFRQGLPAELERLVKAGYTPKDPGLRAIGYREFFVEEPCPLPGDAEGSAFTYRLSCDIEGVKALVAQNSRRYAKRQLTFFSNIPGVHWIEAGPDDSATAMLIRKEIDSFLFGARV